MDVLNTKPNTMSIHCEHQVNIITQRREKTGVLVQDINKIMHSYTVQYVITALDKLLPICLSACKKKEVHLVLSFVKN
jgi:hypothetical protein